MDFCYEKFSWWEKSEKSKINWSNKNDCLKNIENYGIEDENFKHIKFNFYRNQKENQIYYLTCGSEDGRSFFKLNYKLDFESFKKLGEFSVDKDSVYHYYDTSSGRMLLKLETADRNSFEVFVGTVFAKDKNYIFDSRHGIIEEADLKTFEPIIDGEIHSTRPVAKDKNHYFFWNEIITDSIEIRELINEK